LSTAGLDFVCRELPVVNVSSFEEDEQNDRTGQKICQFLGFERISGRGAGCSGCELGLCCERFVHGKRPARSTGAARRSFGPNRKLRLEPGAGCFSTRKRQRAITTAGSE